MNLLRLYNGSPQLLVTSLSGETKEVEEGGGGDGRKGGGEGGGREGESNVKILKGSTPHNYWVLILSSSSPSSSPFFSTISLFLLTLLKLLGCRGKSTLLRGGAREETRIQTWRLLRILQPHHQGLRGARRSEPDHSV